MMMTIILLRWIYSEIFPWKKKLTIVIGRDKFFTDGNLKR